MNDTKGSDSQGSFTNETRQDTADPGGCEGPWILFIPQLPPKPDYLRVKLRRRIQKIGAIGVRNSLYLLPNSEESIEDFSWLRAELKGDGADAMIFSATAIAGITDSDLLNMFDEARSAEKSKEAQQAAPAGKTWVTRSGVFVDRMASAWLIRRFVDSKAEFKFVSPSGYKPEAGEIRFDMYDAEYTHIGDRCTFEVLVDEFIAAKDDALDAIAEIVHDIDMKDGKFHRPETSGVETILRGIASAEQDDAKRVAIAAPVFDGLYAKFSERL